MILAIVLGQSLSGGGLLAVQGEREQNGSATLSVQVFLDDANFGPGIIDGRGGEFTRKAIVRFQKANGLPPNGDSKSLPIKSGTPVLDEYKVTSSDAEQIGSAPKKPAQQAKQHWLPYASLTEMLAEKFHTS